MANYYNIYHNFFNSLLRELKGMVGGNADPRGVVHVYNCFVNSNTSKY